MPRQILPHLEKLLSQMQGIVSRYSRMLDDEFLFGAAVQIPQAATIFDRVAGQNLRFQGEDLTLTELLTLIAYRYGFEDLRVIGHGGYAIVLGHRGDQLPEGENQRRALRLVPEHHVRDIVIHTDNTSQGKEYDVRLNDKREPIRDPQYPLLLSDLFLMPRHTTKLIFRDAHGEILYAAGYPAILHCQLLPEVRAFNQLEADVQLTHASGQLLEAALATLGVSVADAHGGNGGVLLDKQGKPLIQKEQKRVYGGLFTPVVLDYGYYSLIGARTLANILVRHGVTREIVEASLARTTLDLSLQNSDDLTQWISKVIEQSGLPRSHFGRLLYYVQPAILNPNIWIEHAEHHWKTIKERTYPPLQAQSRLSRLYPDYDEVVFPQRIEEYSFTC